MVHFTEYDNLKEIYRTNNRLVFKGRRKSDSKLIILKIPSGEFVSKSETANLKKEFEINKKINSHRITKALGFELVDNLPILVSEDFGGVSLRELNNKGNFSTKTIIKILIKLCKSLEDIHSSNVIHKDIKPENILISPKTGRVLITDFGISTLLNKENTESKSPDQLEGSLSYLSPEQTGRMNRTVDYRSDFYSLGIVFYELITFKKPFESNDPMELVHSHIARNPEPPHKIKPQTSEVISKIILKLMAKSPEDRYKTHHGIIYDLEKCFYDLKHFKEIKDFSIAEKDISSDLKIPEKLYGREKEIEVLLNTYEEVSQGSVSFLLVGGYSGIGKSALINELQKPVTEKRGIYLSGKFDQYQRDIPFSAILGACRNFIKQILSKEQSIIKEWKDKFNSSFGKNASLINQVIPELELIMGNLEPLSELSPLETKNRFNHTFRLFIRSLTKKDQPLALFLDDLQWADSSSLDLIEYLVTDLEANNIMIIGAFRDNEVDMLHPLTNLIEQLEKLKLPPKKIILSPLIHEDVLDLISDSIQRKKEEVFELSNLVMEKTNGNPYFVGEFLKSLTIESLLKFDSNESKWVWNEIQIKEKSITSNVIDLLVNKIKTLEINEIEILKHASCLGGLFSLQDLILTSEKTSTDILKTIWQLLPKGFIEVKGDSSSELQTLIHNESYEINFDKIQFKFLHDRVQQSAYQLLEEKEKEIVHKKIGYFLFQSLKSKSKTKKESKEDLVTIVNHLNYASKLIDSKKEILELIELNLEVAKIAENSGAYPSAFKFLENATKIFLIDMWKTNYELAYNTSIRKAECAYICGKFEESEILFKEILANANSNLDKGRVYEIQVVQYANKNELQKAVDLGREGLKLFGVNLPSFVPLPLVLFEVVKATITKGSRKIEDLLNLPEVKDEEIKMVARLLNHLTSPTYGTNQNLFAFVVTKGVHLALKHGVTDYSAYMFGLYAALVGSKLGLFEAGEKFGHLGINLSNRFNSLSQRCRANFAMGTFVYGWTKHSKDAFDYSLESFRLARETGDNIYSCYSIVEYCSKLVSLGESIDDTHKIISKYTDYVVKQVKDRWIGTLMLSMNYFLLNLAGKTKNKFSFSTNDFDEDQYAREINLEGQGQMDWYHTNKAKTYYFYGEYEKALEMLKKAEEKMVYSFACVITAEQNYFYSLTLAALLDKNPKMKSKYLRKIKQNNSLLKKWAKASPSNFLHKSLLIEAEIARIQEKFFLAEKLYDESIINAKKEGYSVNEAISNELAGKYYSTNNRIKIAKTYLTDAYYGFERWGAIHKVKLFEEKWKSFIQFKRNENQNRTLTFEKDSNPFGNTTEMHFASKILDLSTILKSSQVLSGEIRLNSLLQKMIDILVENAGAERAYFFVNEKDSFVLVASTDLNTEESKVEINIPIDESDGFAKTVVNYVIRTKQTLVIQNANSHPIYKTDDYISKNNTRSILCMPILFHSKLFGIIYLENNLAEGALSGERVDLLNMLSSQIAISYNNAKIYGEMEIMAESFSRFVPREFLEYLGKTSIQEISVGDAMRHKMTIFFSDLRNFTGMSEKMDVKDNFKFLNSYMERMEPIIKNYEGFIDKYIGDAIMALFPSDPTKALLACIEMKLELAVLNKYRREKGFEDIQFGIGLHTGEVMLGTIGSKSRLDTTVIGDAVNLASRLESMTKLVGTNILISDSVYSGIQFKQSFHFREIGFVKIKGKDKPILLYEVFDGDEKELFTKKLKLKPIFEEALSLFYKRNFEKAKILLEECLLFLPSDKVSERYLKYTKIYLNVPPASNWIGSEIWG